LGARKIAGLQGLSKLVEIILHLRESRLQIGLVRTVS
jgi:hypothetical protein